jgi:UDP-N-acetylmuramate--alanine ligase
MRYHLVGIGGSGLSAIATVLIERGDIVSGSDTADSTFLEEVRNLGAQVFIGHAPEHVAGADAVIISSAVRSDNPEVEAARAAGIPVYKRVEFFGPLTAGKRTIAVAGTHGKTTTTGEIAFLLARCGMDPTFITGGALPDFLGANARAGRGEYFVIEADEYDRAFLGLHPWLAVITNLEYDHPDCFPTERDLEAAFGEFLDRVSPEGSVVACADSEGAMRAVAAYAKRKPDARVVTYALKAQADWRAENIRTNAGGGSDFSVMHTGENLGTANSRLPGRHNVQNALAALCAMDACGVSFVRAAEALPYFRGADRRFEVMGEAGGVTIVDDYAHHPSEIRATLSAARQRFPDRRIWALWQPHTFSRTRALADSFAASFADADRVMVLPVYRAREPFDETFSLEELVRKIGPKEAYMIQGLDDAVAVLGRELTTGDVLLTLSAGDANRVGVELLRRLRSRQAIRESAAPGFVLPMGQLRTRFGDRLREGELLSFHSAARLGGPADALLEAHSAAELAELLTWAWAQNIPCVVLGASSNVLISDSGCRELVIINRARDFAVRPVAEEGGSTAILWAESGAMLGAIARQTAQQGWSGLEWAVGIPGTIGGAVAGNAGAFGGDIAGSLRVAEILQRSELGQPKGFQPVRTMMDAAALEFDYRSSRLRRMPGAGIVLSAEFSVTRCEPSEAITRIGEFLARRKRTQPPGASLGSMFKNPPGDFAGRLIEAAGLKGQHLGDAEISMQHANFFLNLGNARAEDVFGLMKLARQTVQEKFGVHLEPEIEFVGDWPERME